MNIDAINEAALDYDANYVNGGKPGSGIVRQSFKAGALSEAAKQHWFEQFKEQNKSAGDETDKIVKELDYLFKKHIGKMFGKAEAASIEYFLQTGKINGMFRFRLSAMIAEAINLSPDTPATPSEV